MRLEPSVTAKLKLKEVKLRLLTSSRSGHFLRLREIVLAQVREFYLTLDRPAFVLDQVRSL